MALRVELEDWITATPSAPWAIEPRWLLLAGGGLAEGDVDLDDDDVEDDDE